MKHERAMQLLNAVIDHISIAENSHTTIRRLLDIGFEHQELVEEFSWSLSDVMDVENEDLLEELNDLVEIEKESALTEEETERYIDITKTLQDRGVEIPFGISI